MTKPKKQKKAKPEDILGTGTAKITGTRTRTHKETMQERIERETGFKGKRWGK